MVPMMLELSLILEIRTVVDKVGTPGWLGVYGWVCGELILVSYRNSTGVLHHLQVISNMPLLCTPMHNTP